MSSLDYLPNDVRNNVQCNEMYCRITHCWNLLVIKPKSKYDLLTCRSTYAPILMGFRILRVFNIKQITNTLISTDCSSFSEGWSPTVHKLPAFRVSYIITATLICLSQHQHLILVGNGYVLFKVIASDFTSTYCKKIGCLLWTYQNDQGMYWECWKSCVDAHLRAGEQVHNLKREVT